MAEGAGVVAGLFVAIRRAVDHTTGVGRIEIALQTGQSSTGSASGRKRHWVLAVTSHSTNGSIALPRCMWK